MSNVADKINQGAKSTAKLSAKMTEVLMKKQKPPMDARQRAIKRMEATIRRKSVKIGNLKSECEEACARIEKTLAKDRYILEGLLNGALKS